jgi:hypothetical protein
MHALTPAAKIGQRLAAFGDHLHAGDIAAAVGLFAQAQSFWRDLSRQALRRDRIQIRRALSPPICGSMAPMSAGAALADPGGVFGKLARERRAAPSSAAALEKAITTEIADVRLASIPHDWRRNGRGIPRCASATQASMTARRERAFNSTSARTGRGSAASARRGSGYHIDVGLRADRRQPIKLNSRVTVGASPRSRRYRATAARCRQIASLCRRLRLDERMGRRTDQWEVASRKGVGSRTKRTRGPREGELGVCGGRRSRRRSGS